MTLTKVAIAFVAALAVNVNAGPLVQRNNDYTVKTSSGVMVGGPNPETSGEVIQWLGIPYGKSERFEESSFADYNSTTKDVSSDFGPACWGEWWHLKSYSQLRARTNSASVPGLSHRLVHEWHLRLLRSTPNCRWQRAQRQGWSKRG